MIQVPPVTTAPQNVQQVPKVYANLPQANYNAVKIDIHNPHVNTPGSQERKVDAPIYAYPKQSVYDVPKQSVYEVKNEVVPPKAVSEAPAVPQPVIMPTVTEAPTTTVPTTAPAVSAVTPVAATAKTEKALNVESKKVDVKDPQAVKPQLDVNEFISRLSSQDYDIQAKAMEEIAVIAQKQPQLATELLDVKVVDSLLGIMNNDSSKLEGPSTKQLEIREKILSGKTVTEAENAEANKITPMEKSERNKQFSIYTTAILQKLYGAEIEKMTQTVLPMTELPGAAGIVEQVKNNPNPMVRAAGIDALSYVQRPEYKQDLTTIFTIAQKDKDVNVQKAAQKALGKLSQLAPAANQAPKAEAKPAPAAAPQTSAAQAKPEVKKA